MMYDEERRIREKQRLFIGLDLGQAQDYSALAIIQKDETEADAVFNCVHLQRWQLKTSYPTIVSETVKIIHSPQVRIVPNMPTFVVDATGVGAPVVDLFKRDKIHADLKPVQITGGADENCQDGVYRVPKRNLVSTVQVLLQERRLRVSPKLAEANILTRELQNFQVKITESANDIYGAWREGTHDDLVLAVALALWAASQPVFAVTQAEQDVFEALTGRHF